MKVKEFVRASYLRMVFREYGVDTDCVIYHFTWEDENAEERFITVYGDYTVKEFKSVADGVIDVYIKK